MNKTRKISPRTLAGFMKWLKRLGYETRQKIRHDIRQFEDDLPVLQCRLKEWWNHLEKNEPLRKIGDMKHQAHTEESLKALEKLHQRMVIRRLPTKDLRRILLNKTTDAEWRPRRGPKRPLPWPWPY